MKHDTFKITKKTKLKTHIYLSSKLDEKFPIDVKWKGLVAKPRKIEPHYQTWKYLKKENAIRFTKKCISQLNGFPAGTMIIVSYTEKKQGKCNLKSKFKMMLVD